MKNHHLAQAIADAGMYEFQRQLTFKAAWLSGGELAVDRDLIAAINLEQLLDQPAARSAGSTPVERA